LQWPTNDAALDLHTDAALDPVVHALLERQWDGITATLARWGKFSRPVHLTSAADRSDLSQHCQLPWHNTVRGLATLDNLKVLQPRLWLGVQGPRALEELLLHELAHVLLFQRASAADATAMPYFPTWFREGMATLVAEGPPEARWRRDLAHHAQLDLLADADDELIALHGDAAYQHAAILFAAWMDRFGSSGLAAVCREMRKGHSFAAAHFKACELSDRAFTTAQCEAMRSEGNTA